MTIETFRVCFGKRSGKTAAIMIHNPLDKIIKTRKQWVFKTLGVELVLAVYGKGKLLITKGVEPYIVYRV